MILFNFFSSCKTMATIEEYTDIVNSIHDMESDMETFKKELRHALSELDNDTFRETQMEADILAKRLRHARLRRDVLEERIALQFRDFRPIPDSAIMSD